jgi:outer membrane protein assembly factor BamB
MFGGYRNNRGDGPRGTPTIDGDFVYVEGGNGDVTCLRADSGETVWHVSLSGDLGGGRPGWGYSESPLVVDDLVVVTPGGRDGTLAALDKRTGEVAWRSGDVTQGAHYASATSAYVAGTRQVVQFARESVFGVNLEDGSFLWSYSGAANGTANCSTPVIDGDYVLSASAYGTGAGLVRVSGSTEEQQAAEIYFEDSLQNHHGGIVKVGDYVYGTGGNTLICMNFMTGEIAWEARAAGKGSLVYADGHLYCLGERNSVVLCEANPEEYVETGRFEIPETGLPSWAHPVIANGRFYIRDQQRLTAYDISRD